MSKNRWCNGRTWKEFLKSKHRISQINMKKILIGILRAIFVIPLTAGTLKSHFDVRFYDCSTSAVVLLLGLLSIIVVFTGSLVIQNGAMKRLTIVCAILTSIVVVGLVVCVSIGCFIYTHGIKMVASSTRKLDSKKLQLAFLWLFAILSTIYFTFKIFVQVQCFDELSIIQIVNALVLIVFIISETGLISCMSSYDLTVIPFFRYATQIFTAVNLSLLINASLNDINEIDFNNHTADMNISSQWTSCVRNATSGILYHKTWEFLSPAFVEFSVLAVTLLTESIPKKISDRTQNQTENKEDDTDETEDEQTPLLNANSRVAKYIARSNSAQSINTSGDYEDPTDHNVDHYPSDNLSSERKPVLVYIVLVVSILICLPIFIGCFVQATLFPDDETLTRTLNWYEVAIKIFMLIAVLFGFYYAERIAHPPTSTRNPFTTKDWIFLGSVFSIYCTHCFEMLAGSVSVMLSASGVYVANFFSILQDYFQTVLLLHMSRCERKSTSTAFVCLCLFLTITNFGCWLVDSFIITHNLQRTRRLQVQVLRQTVWYTFLGIMSPLTVYYRFASAFAFHALLKKFV